jgi:hypothetical protein
MLIGYWSPEKISKTARIIFESNVSPTWKSKDVWMDIFYREKNTIVLRSDAAASSLSEQQLRTRTNDQLIAQMYSFPKRVKPLVDIMSDTEDYKELCGYNA